MMQARRVKYWYSIVLTELVKKGIMIMSGVTTWGCHLCSCQDAG
jgi:hypothetical protein